MGILLNLGIFIGMFIIIFMPYIMCAILAAILICLIRTKAINKIFKILITLMILISVSLILINIKSEKTDDLYREMKEINDSQSIVGLSKEQVVELLGEPIHEKQSTEEQQKCRYNAGNIGKGLFFGNKAIFFDCYYSYVFNIYFDERNIVKSTSLQCIP